MGVSLDEIDRQIDQAKENGDFEERSAIRKRNKERKTTVKSIKKEAGEPEEEPENDGSGGIKESINVDKVCTFSVYFPKNNIEIIITQIHAQNKKNIQRRAKRRERAAMLRKSAFLNNSPNGEKKRLVHFGSKKEGSLGVPKIGEPLSQRI